MSEKEQASKVKTGPTGFHLVRLSTTPEIESDDLLKIAQHHDMHDLGNFLQDSKVVSTRRVIRSISRKRILQLEKRASNGTYRPLHSLTSYFRLDLRHMGDTTLIPLMLQEFTGIDHAYAEARVTDPCPAAGTNPYADEQHYLDHAPDGIDARWAWTQANGEGADVRVVDLEQGWILNHQDLPGPGLHYGDNRNGVGGYIGNHGTAVLGEIAAVDNQIGVIGIAPRLSSINVVSHYDEDSDTTGHVADAICAAIESLSVGNILTVGDILLLEMQRVIDDPPPVQVLPAETDPADLDAIRLATALGIIVIEVAGNGNLNLDNWPNEAGHNVLNRASDEFIDSGAIVVGSARSAVSGTPDGHKRYDTSNFGSRVDCYAWGENVVTTGYGNRNPGPDTTAINGYKSDFGETSGAAPIIAGAAAIVQGKHKSVAETVLSPGQMRALLSNPATGTPQDGGAAEPIGVMPDLRAIINEGFTMVPDVYLRDYVGDTGAVPSTGTLSTSPDIIVTDTLVGNPGELYGAGSGTENTNSLGSTVKAGQDNYVSVRMRNRGVAPATGVRSTVYWSEVATLITPSMWTEIGTSAAMDVPADNSLVVAGTIPWREADVPGSGHYCFVAMLEHDRDPAPPIPQAADWDGFLTMVRNHNNVAWRNFNVIDASSEMADGRLTLQFKVTGAPDDARKFDLHIQQHLPDDVHLSWELPLSLFEDLPHSDIGEVEVNEEKQTVRIGLPISNGLVLPSVHLVKSATHQCYFILDGAPSLSSGGYSLSIRQVFEKDTVGQITWAVPAMQEFPKRRVTLKRRGLTFLKKFWGNRI